MHHSVSGLDCRSCKGAAIAHINNDSGFSTVEFFFDMRSWWASDICFQWVRDLTEAIRMLL